MDGNFKDPNSDTIPEGQAVINFLLRGCYRIMAKMLSENVPVAEALMPVHNQLSTVRRCLVEVTKWGKPDSGKEWGLHESGYRVFIILPLHFHTLLVRDLYP